MIVNNDNVVGFIVVVAIAKDNVNEIEIESYFQNIQMNCWSW